MCEESLCTNINTDNVLGEKTKFNWNYFKLFFTP